MSNPETAKSALRERVNRALGQVRAEYESDDELYGRFAVPFYFEQLLGITPAFLVGGRGTGKTTTLRSMSFKGQTRISGSHSPSDWRVIGAYWKVEPSVVSAFRGRGVAEEVWSQVFSHYLNLKLSSLLIEYALWLEASEYPIQLEQHALTLFINSLGLGDCTGLESLSEQIDLAMVDIESKINGNIKALASSQKSVLGKPLDYLFGAIAGLEVSRSRPFTFCLDEYENLSGYQQRLLNTLIKQVGHSPFTFKIGVRNTVAIDRDTEIEAQPLQDPADFKTVDIVVGLTGTTFERFAATVIEQRLRLIDTGAPRVSALLPGLTLEEEAELLGSDRLRAQLLELLAAAGASDEELDFALGLPGLQASMVLRWAESHGETPTDVLRFAIAEPQKWAVRMGNYGYALLFTIRQKRVGERKYYAGWKTYCQLADGNIRYMIRLVYEALSIHVVDGGDLAGPISPVHQTRAASRVGDTTTRDLQGWSRQGAALTRLSLGLGGIFGLLAREAALTTPEVTQFRVSFSGCTTAPETIDSILGEAVGQGVIIGFDGDKNARRSGATRETDYQLHPVLAPYFVYSPRRKRRTTIYADELLSLTSRGKAEATIRKVLARHETLTGSLPDQLLDIDPRL